MDRIRQISWLRVFVSAVCLMVCGFVLSSTKIYFNNLDNLNSLLRFKVDHSVQPATFRNILLNTWHFAVPGWFLVIVCLVFAVLPWIKSFKRFSLRTMFILTTFIAAALGLAVYLTSQ